MAKLGWDEKKQEVRKTGALLTAEDKTADVRQPIRFQMVYSLVYRRRFTENPRKKPVVTHCYDGLYLVGATRFELATF